jgi:hypothetical protein
MADDDATMLARQFEAAIPPAPALGQLLGPDRLVAPVQTSVGREFRRNSGLIVDDALSSAEAISF